MSSILSYWGDVERVFGSAMTWVDTWILMKDHFCSSVEDSDCYIGLNQAVCLFNYFF